MPRRSASVATAGDRHVCACSRADHRGNCWLYGRRPAPEPVPSWSPPPPPQPPRTTLPSGVASAPLRCHPQGHLLIGFMGVVRRTIACARAPDEWIVARRDACDGHYSGMREGRGKFADPRVWDRVGVDCCFAMHEEVSCSDGRFVEMDTGCSCRAFLKSCECPRRHIIVMREKHIE